MRVLFVNGHVWQSDREREPPASWLLISGPNGDRSADGEVLALGVGVAPDEHRVGSEIIDLQGAIVLPGLQDAHIHISCMGESAHYVELSGCQSVAEVQKTIGDHAENHPDLPWVIGTGWDQNLWSPAKPLTKHDLDAALLCGRPCLLYRRCWHAVVVNSAALRAAGLDPDKAWSSPDNASAAEDNEDGGAGRAEDAGGRAAGGEGGRVKIAPGGKPEGIDVDGDGLPTGLFREGSMRLVESAITAPAFEIRCEQYAEALQRCVRSGLTAVHSNDEDAIKVYVRLQEEGRLPVRVYLTLPHDELDKEQPAVETRGGGTITGGGHGGKPNPWSGDGGLLSWNRVKLFSDGSLGAETAAMRLPYLGTDNRGVLIHEQAALTSKVRQARDRGFRLEVHAIGDRAVSSVLDAFEEAGLTAEDRPIVTHCQVAGPDLVARMGKLGAVAAVQPSFVPSDAAVVMKRLSPSMHASCYPWRSLLNGGVTCAGSSDAPIETHDPFRGMYDAVFRPDRPPSPTGSLLLGDTGETKKQPNQGGVDAEVDDTERGGASSGGGGGRGGRGGGDVTPFLAGERLSLEEAVWMYTAAGALAAGAEDRLGAIRPGLLADLTVVEVEGGGRRLLENPSLLLRCKPTSVWVGGQCRWNNADIDGKTAAFSQGLSSPSLRRSGLPGKNGPKRKRGGAASGRDATSNIPWLSGGIGRMGRCRCCS